MSDLEELYQEILLEHGRQPRHKRPLRPEEVHADAENPVCGDRVRLHVEWESDRIARIEFDGQGCVISQASASLMCEACAGLDGAEALRRILAFVDAMRGAGSWEALEPPELRALSGVRQFPMRIKCATLAWHALERALRESRGPGAPPEPTGRP